MTHTKKYIIKTIFFLFISIGIFACKPVETPVVTDPLMNKLIEKNHPRLLFPKNYEAEIKQKIESNSTVNRLHNLILAEADRIINLPTVVRPESGRILSVSREALRRINFLSYSYRMTGLEKYALRAESELVNVCGFKDWNPTDFLDAAEMALAVSIGYDWLYEKLKPTTKTLIEKKIVELAITPSENNAINPAQNRADNWWLTTDINWNEVCNAGITAAAIALYEKNPTKSNYLISRARNSIKLVNPNFAPDGVYAEGTNYWSYGVGFHVIFIETLRKALGENAGDILPDEFLKTAEYYNHVITPALRTFNYFDSPDYPARFEPILFWFQEINNNPSLVYDNVKLMANLESYDMQDVMYRNLPYAMIWIRNVDVNNVAPTSKLMFSGGGKNPVAMMRSSWTDEKAIYVGTKGGNASLSHSHLDAGSFVLEANGVRWSRDLGMNDYDKLRATGENAFLTNANSFRWKVYRHINTSHSTITVNDNLQAVDQQADIIKSGTNENFMFAHINLSNIYKNDLTSCTRGVALIDKKMVVIQDKFTTPNKTTVYSWRMLTEATIEEQGSNYMVLFNQNEKLLLKVETDAQYTFKTWSTTPPNTYDDSNPGTQVVGFEITVPANKSVQVSVKLIPYNNRGTMENYIVKPMEEW